MCPLGTRVILSGNESEGSKTLLCHFDWSATEWRNLCRRQRQGSGEERLEKATKVARFLHALRLVEMTK
jgi:hypothetical protein